MKLIESVNGDGAVVPFSWEEKPGVPKKSRAKGNYNSPSSPLDNRRPFMDAKPLRKPPRLEVSSRRSSAYLNPKPFKNAEAIILTRRRKSRRPNCIDREDDDDDDPFVIAIRACMKSTSTALMVRIGSPRRTCGGAGFTRDMRTRLVDGREHVTMAQLFKEKQDERQKRKTKEPMVVSASCLGCI